MRWFLVSVVVAVAAGATALARKRARLNRPQVSAVSDEWIAQHRADSPQF
jgi:hypothetical protein